MKASREGKFLTSSKREPAFISRGFSYWKEATVAFGKHQVSQCHWEANEALVVLPKQIRGNIGEVLSTEHKKEQVRCFLFFFKISVSWFGKVWLLEATTEK